MSNNPIVYIYKYDEIKHNNRHFHPQNPPLIIEISLVHSDINKFKIIGIKMELLRTIE